MRQTLIRILLDQPWAVWSIDSTTGIEGVGIGIMVLLIGVAWVLLALHPAMRTQRLDADKSARGRAADSARDAVRPLAVELAYRVGIVAVLLLLAPWAGRITGRASFPIFGYGFMLLIGFLAGIWFARKRARVEGFDSETVFDLSFWILIPGILGGRIAYLSQYWERVFADKSGGDFLLAAVNLSEGGLVLIGAMVGGGLGFFAFCHRRRINPLKLADVVAPSIFLGVGFGRIGCLLNGCCFGDPSSLPWAITFPHGSVPFEVLAHRGFVDPAAAATMPIHPTQIYSSINGFILALLTSTYFYRRRHVGDVFALSLIIYPITRFTIEFLRNDELAQLGTGLTISQIYSLVMCAAGVILYAWLNLRGQVAKATTTMVASGT